MKQLSMRGLLLVILVFGCGYSSQEQIPLVKNGKTTYSIYVDPSAPQSVKRAANDLKNYFIKVTGISPEIILTVHPPSVPFISLGNTYAAKAKGLDASAIPNDGFHMVTIGNNLFILGPDTPTDTVNNLGGVSNGTSNGVYTFIEDYLGVEWLMPGELGEEYTKVKSISIPNLDRIEYSPFNYRFVSFRSSGPLEDEWDQHLKMGKVADVTTSHSWTKTIPPSYFDKHPDWFAQSGGKPSVPTGRYKLETTNPALVQAFAEEIIKSFRKNPHQRWYSLSPSDGDGWSDSPASKVLIETPPNGSKVNFTDISYTPLILKFYNDVAKIVGKEFPDRKLGGYIYAHYFYPPLKGIPKLEPNLVIMVAPSIAYGFRLYQQLSRDNWNKVLKTWSESSQRDSFDLYYYDLPISLMSPNGIIWPPGPDILNFIFSHLVKYGYKGAQIYGNPVWPVFGPGNYCIAKLLWNPNQDAHELLRNYYQKTFGQEAAPFIKNLYKILDTAYFTYTNLHPEDRFNLKERHLKEIYAPHYKEIEGYYLKALAVKKEPKQQQRLELFGQVLSLLQWNLRELGLIPSDYKSPLTYTTDGIDSLISIQHKDFQITRRGRMASEAPFEIEGMVSLPDAKKEKASIVPVYGRSIRMLLYTPKIGEVSITVKAFDGKAEFVRYTLTDVKGSQLRAGVIADGQTIHFISEAEKSYFLDIPSRGIAIKFKVDGAIIAYKTWPATQFGFQIANKYMDGVLPLYFYVPKEMESFNITLGTEKAIVDLYSPDGRQISQLKNVSRFIVPKNKCKSGFWKVVLHRTEGSYISLTLDDRLPQWFIPDPAHPLKIVTTQ